jgi:hypothetical protein
VAVGLSGAIETSPDGVNWTLRSSDINIDLQGVTFGGNHFVAVGYDRTIDSGLILTSADGVAWTRKSSVTTNALSGIQLSAVAYGNNQFVAGGASIYWHPTPQGAVLTSPDGLTWTLQSSNLAAGSIAYCNNRFLMTEPLVGGIATSVDGASWTDVPGAGSFAVEGFAFGSGRFVAVGDRGAIWHSADGILWTNRSQVTTAWLQDITYGNNQFVAVGQQGPDPSDAAAIVTSPDGIRWTDHSPTNAAYLARIAYGNGRFVAVGGDSRAILSSLDGGTWSSTPLPTDDDLVDVAYGEHGFIAVGSSNNAGAVLYSADGVTWMPQASSVTNGLAAVVYGNSQFVAVGGEGVILTSPDGLTWTHRTSGTTNSIDHIAYGNGRFVAMARQWNGIDYDYTLLTSTDGTNWSEHAPPELQGDINYSAITYGNGQFVIVYGIYMPTISWGLASPDGFTWRPTGPGGGGIHGVAFGNNTFVAVGDFGTIRQSGPFVTLGLTPNAGTGLLTLSLTGATGLTYTIQSSSDLISWQTITNITSSQLTTLLFDSLPATSDHVFYRAYSQ